MIRISEIKLNLDHPEEELTLAVANKLNIKPIDIISLTVFKRSYDARRSAMCLIYIVDVEVKNQDVLLQKFTNDNNVRETPDMSYTYIGHAPANLTERPIVIGFGPCGFFAALMLAQMGFKPIVLERGKEVRERTKDTWGLWRKNTLNPESNVQYGEGGAGTFSDGKLYSQVRDPRYLGRKVLEEFVKAGAPEEIIYVNRPHIGTFRLVKMVETIRAKIIELGGEIRFEHKVTDLLIDEKNGKRQLKGVVLANDTKIMSNHIVLALGHSARDTFKMVYESGVYIEAKPFSIGFRVEHPQSVIDEARLGKNAGHPLLGASDYRLVHHAKNGRSVYSFCMCPGGTVVAAASEPNHLVTNGMSQYSRNERNANSAIVVGITPEDFPSSHPLAGIDLQRKLEASAFTLGGENYSAPAQLIGDFLVNKASDKLGIVNTSYKPSVILTNLVDLLPRYAIDAIREAIPEFDKKIRGFAMKDAIFTGVETRTSSPVRIKRDNLTYESLNTHGLYPAGEGAGYAGGILSAAIDGIEVAEAVACSILNIENQYAKHKKGHNFAQDY
ncbi:MAG: NAD(P)/FAD-dependent oxidoreductase [Burkholderiales bacterium]|nr:NAD(P)/FAD-dependent oxidoreductase [Burkholderiales bacterium]